MPDYTIPLDADDAWSRLRSASYGRLAVSLDGQPDVFPLNFLADESTILIRTEEGTKVQRVDANPLVAFEVDDTTPDHAWSVVVKGSAARMDDAAVAAAQRAPLWTWAPEPKDVFLRIRPTKITGRMFTRHPREAS
jgi:nitroimidazol reductase NimA-like FMN-containing flavoprotein (pyridoxamine 5'-phosphate oxidase superfamily)